MWCRDEIVCAWGRAREATEAQDRRAIKEGWVCLSACLEEEEQVLRYVFQAFWPVHQQRLRHLHACHEQQGAEARGY